MSKLEEYRKKAAKLEEYSKMISLEDAETWALVSQLFRYTDYLSPEMAELIYHEIDYQLQKIDEWYDVVEHTDEPSESRTYKTLEPKF